MGGEAEGQSGIQGRCESKWYYFGRDNSERSSSVTSYTFLAGLVQWIKRKKKTSLQFLRNIYPPCPDGKREIGFERSGHHNATSVKAVPISFYAEKELGDIWSVWVSCLSCSLPWPRLVSLSPKQLMLDSETSCFCPSWLWGARGPAEQLPGALWSLCMSEQRLYMSVAGVGTTCHEHSHLPLNHGTAQGRICCVWVLSSADLSLPSWSHSTTVSWVYVWEFERAQSTTENVPVKLWSQSGA